jgi:hypothetical protein
MFQLVMATAGRRWAINLIVLLFSGLQVAEGIPSGPREKGSCENKVKLKRHGQH